MSSNLKLNAAIRGFTMLELMIVVFIVSIGLALAVPTYRDLVQRKETTAQAEGLVAFMSFAQSEAVKYNKLISVHLTYTDAKDWCIGANEGHTPCDCTETNTAAANFCSLNGVAKILRSTEKTRSGMTTPSVDRTLVFDMVRGTMVEADLGTDHTATLQSDNGNWSLQVGVEPTGRIRVCNPASAAKKIPGYPGC